MIKVIRMDRLLVIFSIKMLYFVQIINSQYEFNNWKFHFLPGSGMGLFMAVALPLDLPNKNVYLAYNFEANYALPDNSTYLEYPPLIQRSIDRQLIYTAFESKIQSNGYPGQACLLRTICESNLHPMNKVNGVLGDILHIIFTPSSSVNGNLSSVYEKAENEGRNNNNCKMYNKNCTVSFMDMISWIGQSI